MARASSITGIVATKTTVFQRSLPQFCYLGQSAIDNPELHLAPTISIRVVGYGIVLWLVGFVWGVIVFIVPSLWNIPSVAYVSKLPAVSVVLIPGYGLILALVARTELRGKSDKMREGLKFGLSLVVINILLDLLVYVVLFRSLDYFSFLSIWFAYALFLLVPALVGRSLRDV